jgi:hypothetical protein
MFWRWKKGNGLFNPLFLLHFQCLLFHLSVFFKATNVEMQRTGNYSVSLRFVIDPMYVSEECRLYIVCCCVQFIQCLKLSRCKLKFNKIK